MADYRGADHHTHPDNTPAERRAPVVRAVLVGAEEWPRWRALRLAALAEAPHAFSSTLAGATGASDTEERWRDRLTAVPHNVLVVAGGHDVAMVSLTAPDADEHPELISMWVAPEARGTGAADLAVRTVLAAAAAAYPGRSVVLSVHENNVAARRLYARHGFVEAGPSPDGPGELRMVHHPVGGSG